MTYRSNRTRQVTILSCALFLLAGILHELEDFGIPQLATVFFLLDSIIYIGLATGWAISIRQRIMEPRMQRLLTGAALLAALWILLRTCKYRLFSDDLIKCYLWYLYYLPQLFAPLLVFCAALELGHVEAQPLSRRWYLLFVPATLLFIGIMTNNLHQLAFRFPPGYICNEADYTHGPLYFTVLAWMLGMMIASAAILFRKCRVSHIRKYIWLPASAFFAGLVLSLLSFANLQTVYMLPESFCATFIVTWECCIQIGLVPSNANYGGFFSASTISAQIADGDGRVVFDSAQKLSLTAGQRRQSQDGVASIDSDTRLHSQLIRGGRVYWTDSVAQINRINAELAEIGSLLSEDNELTKAENEARLQRARLEEQNRLYDGMLALVRPQLDRIDSLLRDLTADSPDFPQRIGQISIYGAYIKRRCNLALIRENEKGVRAQELALCIRESLDYMSPTGVVGLLQTRGDAVLAPEAIILAYECFEAALESALPTLSAMLVNLYVRPDGLTMRMSMEDVSAPLDPDWSKSALSALGGSLRVEQQSGTVYVTLQISKAGDGA